MKKNSKSFIKIDDEDHDPLEKHSKFKKRKSLNRAKSPEKEDN